ncbi:MAG: hypothetical protein QM296_08345, partial [Bacillota bacterium]|nr:hypothetical protein [Bacillota bacterium]
RNRGRNEKIDQVWPKKTVCAREQGHKPRFLARGGQKMRWCPEIGAGAKKLSKGGQKRRLCPQIWHKPRFLATAGPQLLSVRAELGTSPLFAHSILEPAS